MNSSPDLDPAETQEWRDALRSLIDTQGPARARAVLDELARLAHEHHVGWQPERNTPYVNTIAVDDQPPFPGDLAIEEGPSGGVMERRALVPVPRRFAGAADPVAP